MWRAPGSCGSLGIVKRSTVVRHFREIADAATRVAGFDPGAFDLPALVEVWVGGDLVEQHGEIDHVVAVLVLDVPADQLPEISLHPAERAAVSWLEIEKRPMITRSRPATRPPWSHLERRVARAWSRDQGVDAANLGALATGDLDAVDVVAPADEDLVSWLRREIPRSESHLRAVLDGYWEGDWRRAHTGGGIHPEDHLWRAAWAVQSMHDALAELA